MRLKHSWYRELRQVGWPSIALILSLLLMGLGGWLAYRQQQQQDGYTELVNHTNRILVELGDASTRLYDAESSQVRYRITRHPDFLRMYATAQGALQTSLRQLQTDIRDSSARRALEQLRRQAEGRLRAVILTRPPGALVDEFLASKAFLNGAQEHLNTIRQAQERLLKTRTRLQNQGSILAPFYTTGALTLGMGLLLVSFGQVLKQFRRRRHSELSLREKVIELQRSNEELERFAYVASHDLQEPLRKVRAFSSKLHSRQKALLSDEGREWLGKIEQSAARMQTLINDLLNFSRLISSKDERVTLPLKPLVDELVDELAEAIRASNARVEVGALPQLSVYPFQMRQLFQNLLSNSIKFRKPDQALVVRVTHRLVKGPQPGMPDPVSPEQGFHAIAVSDNGIGFEQKFADRIMLIFQRLHGVLDYSGTGIGLAICKKVASNHGGYLTATSELGQGATFTLYLPAGEIE